MNEQKNLVIDANIILRHILYDLAEQAIKVKSVLQKAAEGDLLLLVPEPVVSDVVFVLSHLKVKKLEIAEAVRDWLSLPGVELLGFDLNLVEMALDLFGEKNIKWSDALIAAKMLSWGYNDICTFGHHFKRVPGINVLEP